MKQHHTVILPSKFSSNFAPLQFVEKFSALNFLPYLLFFLRFVYPHYINIQTHLANKMNTLNAKKVGFRKMLGIMSMKHHVKLTSQIDFLCTHTIRIYWIGQYYMPRSCYHGPVFQFAGHTPTVDNEMDLSISSETFNSPNPHNF